MFKQMVFPAIIAVPLLFGGLVMAAPSVISDFSRGSTVEIVQYADKGQGQETSQGNNANENEKVSPKHSCCKVKEG